MQTTDTYDNLPSIMDLAKLKQDVLDKPFDAALPCNLSDSWLNQLGESLEVILDSDQDSLIYIAGPLALIFHILQGKANSVFFEVTEDALSKYFQDYRIEVTLEQVSRRTTIKSTPATLETIFTNRTVEIANRAPE